MIVQQAALSSDRQLSQEFNPWKDIFVTPNPFQELDSPFCSAFSEDEIDKHCRRFLDMYGYIGSSAKADKLMEKTRPGLAGILNCTDTSPREHVELFGDIFVWFVLCDDLLESFQPTHTQWSEFRRFEAHLARLAFDAFGFQVRSSFRKTPLSAPSEGESKNMKVSLDKIDVLVAGLRDVLERAAELCICDLQYLNFCLAIEAFIGANAFEGLQRGNRNIIAGENNFRRYDQMRYESVGQCMSMELALILRGINVPRHVRNTLFFRKLFETGTELVWKANDLIGSMKDWLEGQPINGVCILARQRNISLRDAQIEYRDEIYLPAANKFRQLLNSTHAETAIQHEILDTPEEREIALSVLKTVGHICRASVLWNLEVGRYVPERTCNSDII